jgi:hypothetical protein
MSREGADYAVGRLRGEKARIAAALLELENHPGHRLLSGARLNGETRRRWDETQAHVTSLWRLFHAYGRTLDRAERLRGRQARLGQAELEELTWLLTGSSVELLGRDGRQRQCHDAVRERLTLEEVATRMTEGYEEAVDMVAAADTAWSALLPRLEEMEQSWRAVRGLLTSLDTPDRDRDGIGRRLAEARKVVLADPLSLVHDDGHTDTAHLDRLRADLAARRSELEEAVRHQSQYADGRAVEAPLPPDQRAGTAGDD